MPEPGRRDTGAPEGRACRLTGQRFRQELKDKDELSKVALNEGLKTKKRMTAKEAGGRQPPCLKKTPASSMIKVAL